MKSPIKDLLFITIIRLLSNLLACKGTKYLQGKKHKITNFLFILLRFGFLSDSFEIYATFLNPFAYTLELRNFPSFLIPSQFHKVCCVFIFHRFGSKIDVQSGANVKEIRWMLWQLQLTLRMDLELNLYNHFLTPMHFIRRIHTITIGLQKCHRH